MPTTINLKQTSPGIDPATQSIRVWLYASGVNWAPGNMPAGEVPLAQAHYCVFTGFTGKNATGVNNLPYQVFDTGPQTLQQAYPQATSVDDAILLAFPPPQPD